MRWWLWRTVRLFAGLPGWFAFASSTVVHGIGILLSAILPWDPDRRFALTAMRWTWGHMNMWLNPIWFMDPQGLDQIGKGPYIVVSNHQSFCDIPNVVSLPLPIRLVARPGIADAPVFHIFRRLGRHIHVARLLEDGRDSLSRGISLLIFPEGTRSTDGKIHRFRSGAFHLAQDTGAQILPVVTSGGELLMPKYEISPVAWPVTVRVRVLPPVNPAHFADPVALKHHVRTQMVTALKAL